MDHFICKVCLWSYLGTLNVIIASEIVFPSIPDCFKTRISGKINNVVKQAFIIEQYYCDHGDRVTGKTILSSDIEIRGFIYDEYKNHSLRFNYTDCDIYPLNIADQYEPFDFTGDKTNPVDIFKPLIDVLIAFQNSTLISSTEMVFEDGMAKTIFIHAADPHSSYPYAINVSVNNDMDQVDRVVISEGNNRRVTMRYNDIISISDPAIITIPPHDVLCKSDQQVDIPKLGMFYYMEIRILSEYYKKQESLGLVKLAEYMYDGLVSVGYHANTDTHLHSTVIVHDYKTGAGALMNRDMELCHRYQINTGDLVLDRKEQFKSQILNEMHFFDKKYFVHFWQVLEMVKNETTNWEYQGTQVIDSTTCNVWAHVLLESWVAQVAFSQSKIRLRENSFSNKMVSVPVSVDLYRLDSPDESEPAISFRVSDFQIDGDPVSTELLFDTSMCYDGESSCVVQFKLDITFQTLLRVGLGNVKRAISQAVAFNTQLDPHQIHHLSVSSVPNGQSLITMTVYHGSGINAIVVKSFKDRIRLAVDNRMHATFTNENTDTILIAYSVKGSLVFDYLIVKKPHWSDSLATTVSLSVGTMFVGFVLGVLFAKCWNKRKMTATSCQLSYRRFKEEDIEEVEMDSSMNL